MKSKRLPWVDSLRGLAIFLMVIYHFLYDLNAQGLTGFNLYSGGWLLMARFVQFTFLSLVGFSLFLSYQKYSCHSDFLIHQLKRAFFIFLLGMLVTLATYFTLGDLYVRFGILHFISASILIIALLIPSGFLIAALLMISLIFGAAFPSMSVSHPLLLPFGITDPSFQTVDYFPLFPWLSIVCAGYLWAKIFHALNWMDKLNGFNFHWLGWLGKHSLLIYMIHQPVLLMLIWLIF